MGDNTVQIRVASDLSPIKEAMAEVNQTAQALQRTIAESAKAQGASVQEVVQIYKQLGLTGAQAANEIKTAFDGVNASMARVKMAIPGLRWPPAVIQDSQNFSQSVRTNLADFMVLRRAMSSTVGLASLVFMVSQWKNVADEIAHAAQTLGGFDAGLRQMEKDAAAASLEAIDAIQEFTPQQFAILMQMKDIHAFRQQQAADELQNTRDSQERIRQYLNSLQQLKTNFENIESLQDRAALARVGHDEASARAIEKQIDDIKSQVSALGDLEGLQKKIDEQQKLIQDRAKEIQSIQLRGHAMEIEATDREARAGEAAERKKEAAARRAAEFHQRVLHEEEEAEKRNEHQQEESAKAQQKAFEAAEKSMRQFPVLGANFFAPLIDGTVKLTAAQRLALPTEVEIARVRSELARIVPNLTKEEQAAAAQRLAANPGIQADLQNMGKLSTAHKILANDIARLMGVQRQEWQIVQEVRLELSQLGVDTSKFSERQLQAMAVSMQFVGALNREVAAYGFTRKALRALASEEISELANYLAKKADMKALEQLAEAMGAFADGNYVGGAEHLAAAAAWGALGAAVSAAGGAMSRSGGSGKGGGSNGGGGSQPSYGRGGDGGSGGGGGGAAMPGTGPTIHLHIAGVISSDNLGQVMAQMSQLTKSGQATLDSTNALYNGPKLG